MESLKDEHGLQVTVRETTGTDRMSGAFPWLETPSAHDLLLLERQLGRHPQGRVYIARRCRHGCPAVILTVPFDSPGRAVPPLLWLSCPHAARVMGRLEGEGFGKGLAGRLEADGEYTARFLEEEERFSTLRREIMLESGGERLSRRIEDRGVAGGRKGAVKCMHAHLAYRLSTGRGVVGGWCLEELEGRSGTWCEGIPEACVY